MLKNLLIILWGFPCHITSCFLLAAFSIFSLSLTFEISARMFWCASLWVCLLWNLLGFLDLDVCCVECQLYYTDFSVNLPLYHPSSQPAFLSPFSTLGHLTLFFSPRLPEHFSLSLSLHCSRFIILF